MAWSNNAENIYAFRINRVEPLNIPYVSKVLGPMRYDFFVGSLKGHTVSECAVGAFRDVFVPPDGELRVWVSANGDLGRRGPCAGHAAHVSARAFST